MGQVDCLQSYISLSDHGVREILFCFTGEITKMLLTQGLVVGRQGDSKWNLCFPYITW